MSLSNDVKINRIVNKDKKNNYNAHTIHYI